MDKQNGELKVEEVMGKGIGENSVLCNYIVLIHSYLPNKS